MSRQVALAAGPLDVGAPARLYIRGAIVKKGRRDRYASFVGLERKLIRSAEYRQLSPRAVTLYTHIKAKYNGGNNGAIVFHYSEIQGAKGFASDKTICATIKELECKGWIERTHVGGLYRFQNLFKLTGKYDAMV
jgi:hypothetical protein